MIGRLLAAGLVLATVGAGSLVHRRRRSPPHLLEIGDIDLPMDLSSDLAVIVFTSPFCRACQHTAGRIAEALGVDEAELRQGCGPVVLHEVDVREHGTLVNALGIRRTPTIAGIDADEHLGFILEGNPPVDELADHLEGLVEGG